MVTPLLLAATVTPIAGYIPARVPTVAKRLVALERSGPAWDAPKVDAVYCMDLFDLVGALAPQSVDMILADLPYGTTACSWDEVIPFEPMWAAFKRVIKPRGAIVLTASQPFTSRLVCSNLGMFKYSWVWTKTIASGFQHAPNKPLKAHEDVLVFSIGAMNHASLSGENRMDYYPQFVEGKPWARFAKAPNVEKGGLHRATRSNFDWVGKMHGNDKRYPTTVLHYPNPNNDSLHPTQKPVALFEYLIRTYTQPGDVVLDPVCGSGTTAVAARNTDRHYICGDISQEYVNIARERLRLPFEPHHVVKETDLTGLPLFATP